MKIKLTKTIVETLPFEAKGQKIHWDKELPGFGILIGKTKKSYIVQSDIKGASKRITIGSHQLFTPDIARKEAKDILQKMSKGIDPVQEKRDLKIKGISLHEMFSIFMKERGVKLSKATQRNYRDFFEKHLRDWNSKEMQSITYDMIKKRHEKIENDSGPYAAHHTMKFVQTLYKYAEIEHPNLGNPVAVLSRQGIWLKKTRRDSLITNSDLPKWYKEVMNLNNQTIKDCLVFLLFTGLRKTEAFTLEWKNVDFNEKTFLIPKTKNGKPLKLPLSPFLLALLQRRKETAGDSNWVFPGSGKDGHLTEMKATVRSLIKASGVKFMIHDLRRTFITNADALGFSSYSLKKLLNHSVSGDVTAGYIVPSAETLRKIVDEIASHFLAILSPDISDKNAANLV